MSAFSYSLQHDSQQPRQRSIPGSLHYMNGSRDIDTWRGTHTEEYCLALKRKNYLFFTGTWVGLEGIMFSEIS